MVIVKIMRGLGNPLFNYETSVAFNNPCKLELIIFEGH
jgi:hypothetical protein